MADRVGMFRWSHRNLVDLLDAQAEKLARDDADMEALLALFPELAEEARPLMALASGLANALQPVRPRAAFRAHLRRGLIDAARRRYTLRAATSHSGRASRFVWLLGAAAVGSAVSVVGLLAYLLRSRHQGHVEQAVSR
ncbi:MAG: hypothetical protein RML36_08415 [Anaerolineae bacterium]|nr:hypothetical protein [Anaerolineae bacterium]MDW8099487.1 hypothetical protein [Anaerolineae bacterium]